MKSGDRRDTCKLSSALVVVGSTRLCLAVVGCTPQDNSTGFHVLRVHYGFIPCAKAP
jgi:hypothetical protein